MPGFQDRLREVTQKAGFEVPGSTPDENIKFQPVRATPKGTYVEAEERGSVTLRFKAAIRFWWMLPHALVAVTLFFGFPLAWTLGTVMRSSPFAAFNMTAFLLTALFFIAATVVSYRLTRPWVKLVANRRYIKVGPYYFDRAHYGGMRLGYELNTGAGELKNDFHDLSIGMQALRLTYGPWGEDLPYLVNKYHANEIALWMNIMIAPTQAQPIEAPVSSGNRRQSF